MSTTRQIVLVVVLALAVVVTLSPASPQSVPVSARAAERPLSDEMTRALDLVLSAHSSASPGDVVKMLGVTCAAVSSGMDDDGIFWLVTRASKNDDETFRALAYASGVATEILCPQSESVGDEI